MEVINKKIFHKKFGHGQIIKMETIEDGCLLKFYLYIKFENDKEKIRKIKIDRKILEDKIESSDINIKEIFKYVEDLNIKHKINYLKLERKKILNERNIKYLIHFTEINNLETILKYGILSKNKLIDSQILFNETDEYNRGKLSNYICTTISFPNYKMFFKKQIENVDKQWIILKIDASIIIDKMDSIFSLDNSANNEMINNILKNKEEYMTNSRLLNLFDNEILYQGKKKQRYNGLPNNYTTNPQSEVLIKDCVERKYIKEICIKNLECGERINNIINKYNINVNYDNKLFNCREDYLNWQSKNEVKVEGLYGVI